MTRPAGERFSGEASVVAGGNLIQTTKFRLCRWFFEFEKLRGGGKQPHYFRLRDGQPFAFAGLYERWRGEDGEVVDSCAILTTEASDLVRPVHPRMPVILRLSDFGLWLNPDVTKAELLTELFAPYPAEEMTSHPVSALVNRPNVDIPEIINPVQELKRRPAAGNDRPASGGRWSAPAAPLFRHRREGI